MKWNEAVMGAIVRVCRRKGSATFTRRELIVQELVTITEQTQCAGKTPEQTLSRVLQSLRDHKRVDFVDNDGTYRLNAPW